MPRDDDAPTFLFCLSIRAGVLILSLTTAAISSALAVLAWSAISRFHTGMLALAPQQQLGVLVLGGAAPAFGAFFLLGVVAGASARRTFVSAYAWTATALLPLSLLVGALVLVGVLQPSTASADGLPVAGDGPGTLAGAEGQTLTALVVVVWAVQLFGCINAFQYRGQLAHAAKEDAEMRAARPPVTISAPVRDPRYMSAAFM